MPRFEIPSASLIMVMVINHFYRYSYFKALWKNVLCQLINDGRGLTLLALEGDVEVLAPVVHGEVLGGLEAGADQLGAHHADGHLLVRVPRVRLAQLAVEEVLLVLQHATITQPRRFQFILSYI